MPEDHYYKIDMIQKILRQKDNNSAYSSVSLIPIPGHKLYEEIKHQQRNKNEILQKDLAVLFNYINLNYFLFNI